MKHVWIVTEVYFFSDGMTDIGSTIAFLDKDKAYEYAEAENRALFVPDVRFSVEVVKLIN